MTYICSRIYENWCLLVVKTFLTGVSLLVCAEVETKSQIR